jgi:hypothetical protein
MDFSFWGLMEDNVYIPSLPVAIQGLFDRIVNAIALVDIAFWNKLGQIRLLPGYLLHNQGQPY